MKHLAAILALTLISACGQGAPRLDPTTLRSIPDAGVEQAIIDHVIAKLDGHEDREAQIVKSLPAGVRATWLTWIVEAEVNNGGFNQYYYNTDGRFASEAVAAFEYFGAKEHAALMREANAVRAAEAKLGPLDDKFYGLAEDLSQLRIARIRQAPEEFSSE